MMSDYKVLYEQQREENEEYRRRILELEARQRVLECSFRGLRQLRHELSSLHKESQESERNIQSFLSTFLPEYRQHSRAQNYERSDGASRDWYKRNNVSQTAKDEPKSDHQKLKVRIPEPEDNVGEKLPLPSVSYDWCESKTKSRNLPSYLPRQGYNMISGPRCNLIGQPSMVDEELKLTLKFENCPSRNLPTKLHLEICDSQGNVVFRKRQNIYYVKLQEKLATLDSGNDYVLTVTSIQGSSKTSEKVTIHNKNYQPPPPSCEPIKDPKSIFEMPELMTALQEFSDEVEYFEEAELRRNHDQDEVLASAKSVDVEDYSKQVKQTTALVLQRAPLEDPEDSIDLSTSTSGLGTSINSSERPAPIIITRKPILPMEIRHRWQRGFRRRAGGSGQYVKVPILRVEVDFDPDLFELLPSELVVDLTAVCNQSISGHTIKPFNLVSKLSHNRRYCFEFPFFDCKVFDCCHLHAVISERVASSKNASLVPDFVIELLNLQVNEDNEIISQWHNCTPEVMQLF